MWGQRPTIPSTSAQESPQLPPGADQTLMLLPSNNSVFDTSETSLPDLMYDCRQKHLSHFWLVIAFIGIICVFVLFFP